MSKCIHNWYHGEYCTRCLKEAVTIVDELEQQLSQEMLKSAKQLQEAACIREAAQAWVEANDNLIEAHTNLKGALEASDE
jgi:uncharacterized membrane protein YqiK